MNLHTLTERTATAAYIGMCWDTVDDIELVDYINASPSPTAARLVYAGQWRIELTEAGVSPSRVIYLHAGDWLVRDAHDELEPWRVIRKAAATRYDVRALASNVDTTASNGDTHPPTLDGPMTELDFATYVEHALVRLKLSRAGQPLKFETPPRTLM